MLQKPIEIDTVDKNTKRNSKSTEPLYAVNISPLPRFEPTTSTTPPSTSPDIDATNCDAETTLNTQMGVHKTLSKE